MGYENDVGPLSDHIEAYPVASNEDPKDLIGQHLLPAPSNDPKDPLNWPVALKVFVLIQVSLLSALGGINTAMINPAYVPMAKELHISSIKASYQTTICIALAGIAPFLWVPLSNKYGRRPVLLGTTLLAFVSILGSAYAKSFNQLIAARVFNGLFPAAFALGPAVVVDMFFVHQRGRAMGVFTVTTVNGSHIAPLLGGPIGQYLGWRWCFKFGAICDGVMFVVVLFCLPETLYVRPEVEPQQQHSKPHYSTTAFIDGLKIHDRTPDTPLRWSQFVLPICRLAMNPHVVFPALYYATQYGFASILPAVTVASIFNKEFKWDTLQIGLGYGGALTIGGSLGELAAGLVLDAIVKKEMRKRIDFQPEIRLRAIWHGEILVPAGLLIYGFTMQYKTFWVGPLMGMGIAAFGLQVITTTCYTYATDCRREQSNDIAQLFNFIRQTFGFTFAFYAVDLCNRIGYQFTFLLFAILGSVVAFIPILGLIWRGRQLREKKSGVVEKVP